MATSLQPDLRTRLAASLTSNRTPLLFLLGLCPLLAMLAIIVAHWLPLPFWDEWNTPGDTLTAWCEGTLSWRHLVAQHNESRMMFPRLLSLLLAQLGGWDVRKEMALAFLSVCATALLFWRLMRDLPGATSRSAVVTWIAATFLCFSAVQFENFLWGLTIELFFPGLALLAIATINQTRWPLAVKASANGLLALIATYTIAHGMLLWILGLPVPTRDQSARKPWLVYLIYFAAAAFFIGIYFIGYSRPPNHPPILGAQFNSTLFAHYLTLWIGSYFNSELVSPFFVGATAIAIFATALLAASANIFRTREWRPYYPALLIAAYACATAAITTAGRVGFGLQQALDDRYRVYSLTFYLAIVALTYTLYCTRFRSASQPTRRNFFVACSVLGMAAFIGWIACYSSSLKQLEISYQRRVTALRALQWINLIPDNPDLAIIFPEPAMLPGHIRILREHHMLQLDFLNDETAQRVREIPLAPADEPFGAIQTCVFRTPPYLLLKGRARYPRQKRKPDCVLIGLVEPSGILRPVSLLETTRSSKKKRGYAWFSRAIKTNNFPAGDVTIAAWAVDLRERKAYPLAGTTTIAAAER